MINSFRNGQTGPYAQTVVNNANRRRKGQARPDGSGSNQTPANTPALASGQPLDPTYEAYLNQARYNRALADTEATYQTGQIKQSYGIEDQSNPYSRAALLRQNYLEAKRGTTTSLASQGQINSGASKRLQGENDRQYSIADDQLKRDYADALHNVQYGQAQTYANYGTGVDDQALQALLRALGGG